MNKRNAAKMAACFFFGASLLFSSILASCADMSNGSKNGGAVFSIDSAAAKTLFASSAPSGLADGSRPLYIDIELKGDYSAKKKSDIDPQKGAVVEFDSIPVGSSVWAEANVYHEAQDILYTGKSATIVVAEGMNPLSLLLRASGGGSGGGGSPDAGLAIPLTFEAIEAGAKVTFINKAANAVTYKKSDGTEGTVAVASGDEGTTIALENVGDKVSFYGDNGAYATDYLTKSCIECDKDCYVYGNIMSLIKSSGFESATELAGARAFYYLFCNTANVSGANGAHIKNKAGSDLYLPATTLTESCYNSMFSGCSSLTKAPALPAATLAKECYVNMFNGCSSLTSAPALPSTTLAEGCYNGMFSGCSSLTEAPELAAPTLVKECYKLMFTSCTSLASVTCLATNISADGCVSNWFLSASTSGTFTKAAGMESWPRSDSGIPSGWTVQDYGSGGGSGGGSGTVGLSTPLTIEAAVSGAKVTFTNKATGAVTYKKNGGTEETIASGSSAEITLEAVGDKVSFYGDNTYYSTNSEQSNIFCDKDCYVYGNIMSLVDSDGFENSTQIKADRAFNNLFMGNGNDLANIIYNKITNKEGADLFLPATVLKKYCYNGMFRFTNLTKAPALEAETLATGCYASMFEYCSMLQVAPELKAQTLVSQCYQSMFANCSMLQDAPELPSTTLAEMCYGSMFANCSSLANAPELKAQTLASQCYQSMFNGCSSLSSVTCLATNISASSCLNNWLRGVSSTGTFTKAASMTGWDSGDSGIPSDWTVKNYGAVDLSTPLTIEAAVSGAKVTFVNNASDAVTFKKNGGTEETITRGSSAEITLEAVGDKVSFYGNNTYCSTSSNNSNIFCDKDCYVYGNIMSLMSASNFENLKEITTTYAFSRLFYSTSTNTNKIKNKEGADLYLPATTLSTYCYNEMFRYATLTKSPELKADTLANGCYQSMFEGCGSLASVTCLATDINASNCTRGWLSGVATSGTFTKAAGMEDWGSGDSGIPSGWTVQDYSD